MPKVPQPPNASEKDPAPPLVYVQTEITGVDTSGSRTAVGQGKVYNLENIIPIGPENAQVVPNIGPPIVGFGTDTIYWAQSMTTTGVPPGTINEYIFSFATSGRMYAVFTGSTVNQVWVPHSQPFNPAVPLLSGLSGTRTRMVQWSPATALIIDQTGLYSYGFGGSPPQLITGPGVPTSGDDITVFAGRVWIASGRTIFFSGAGDYSAASWLPANGAGFFTLIDPQIRSNVQRLMVSNGLLYIISNSGINVISNVVVPFGSIPPTPTFQNTNIQALIGCDQPSSVFPLDRFMMFGNRYGAFIIYGLTATKISADIDGTWQYLDFTKPMSGGAVTIANILCAAFLIQRANDPVFGSNTVVAVEFEKEPGDRRWFFVNYGAVGTITLLVSSFVANQPALYGIIGSNLYQLFSDTTTAPNCQIMTGLMPMEDELAKKEVTAGAIEANYSLVQTGGSITATADTDDTDFPSRPITFPLQPALGTKLHVAGGANFPSTFNRHVGMTINTTGLTYKFKLFAMEYKLRERLHMFLS